MNKFLCLKRPFIWLSRFRNRCGYGIHSPFAFGMVTDVIYERRSYYSYRTLSKEKKEYLKAKGWERESSKINHLLFRLVNRIQPKEIITIGRPCVSTLYLRAGKPTAQFTLMSPDSTHASLNHSTPIDFLYIDDCQNPAAVEDVFNGFVDCATPHGVFVIRGICYSSKMKRLWKQIIEDERVGITFDLYDIGLLFFDLGKIKQHYIINF